MKDKKTLIIDETLNLEDGTFIIDEIYWHGSEYELSYFLKKRNELICR